MPQNTIPNHLPFEFTGKVIPGDKVGRGMGFPTANLDQVPSEAQLKPGIYAGYCKVLLGEKVKNERLKCLIYFGPRYVFGEKTNSFEVYIYQYDQTIYDHTLEVEAVFFIRPPADVSSLTELKELLEADKTKGIQLLQL